MASDVDIILEVAVDGLQNVNNLSNALNQLNRTVTGVANPMRNLDARSRALSQALGSSGRSINDHAKTLQQAATNHAVLTSEINKTAKEIRGLGTEFKFGAGASAQFTKAATQGLKDYNKTLHSVRARVLVEDLKAISQESKRLGKDMQFVGRSLIIGLTTPIMLGARQALQGLIAIDKETIRLTKVLEGVAPNAEIAASKLGNLANPQTVKQMVDNFEGLNSKLTATSQKFGIARSLTTSLAADFAELGVTNTDNIAALTNLTAVTEKLGNMDITNAQNLVQSLYFQATRTIALTQPHLSAIEREKQAIGSATAQLNMFNVIENTTALTLRDLGDAFPEVAAAATSFGLSMTEAGALLAPMKSAGFEVGASANSIKVSLQRIVAPTKQNKDMLASLSKQYKVNFNEIKGSGLDAIQMLVDGYHEIKESAAGAEGAQAFMAKLFGVRQGPRMEVAIQQMALFNSTLKNTNADANLAEKKIQKIANSVISATDSTLPLINSFKDIGVITRIATAQAGQEVESFSKSVTQSQIDAAKRARVEIGKEIAKRSEMETLAALKAGKKAPGDLLSQVATETGRAMFTELAGPANAAVIAQQELDRTLQALDVRLAIIKNNFKSFATELIKGMQPAITRIADLSNKLTDAWKNLSPETKKLIGSVVLIGGGLTAAIGPLIFIFGQFRLAMGSVSKVLFSFLPGLKTMSIESLAGREAMLKLKNPLQLVGDTVVNTNGKFATWIATLSSGGGKISTFAQKVGKLTGVLKETTTASMPLTRQVMSKKNEKTGIYSQISGGSIGKAPKLNTGAAKPLSTLDFFKQIIPGGSLGTSQDLLERAQDVEKSLKAKGLTYNPATNSFRNAGGRFTRPIGIGTTDKSLLRALYQSRAQASSARIPYLQGVEKEAFFGKRGVGFTASTSQLGPGAKDLYSFKGRDISSKQAENIYRGGLKGIGTRASVMAGGLKDTLAGKMPKMDTGPITGYKNSIAGAKAAVAQLKAEHALVGVQGPRTIAKMSAAMSGFTNATKLGTTAMKLMKIAVVSSGIGAIILGISLAVFLVIKNMNTFKEKASGAINIVGSAFKTIKDAALEIIRPILDMFRAFGDGSKGTEGAVSGISKAFTGLALAFKWVANMFKTIVEKFIQPYLYFIVNIVAAVVSMFQGNWKKAFGFLKAGAAFAVEFLINAFSVGLKLLVTIVAGIVKAIISLFGMLAKTIVDAVVSPIKLILSGLANLPFGLGDKFKGMQKAFNGVVDGAKGLVDSATGAVNGVIDSAANGTKKAIDSAAKGLKGKLGDLKKGGIDKSKGKVELGAKVKPPEKSDLDDIQETVANSVGTGMDEGAQEGGKKAAQRLRSLKEELQQAIMDRVKDSMNKVVDTLNDALQKQKDESLKVFDQQLETIDKLKKAEESLTKTKEFENKKRELEEERALNRANFARNKALAIYEGRIDDARNIGYEEQKAEKDINARLSDLQRGRNKEIADENLNIVKDSITEAKKASAEYFDEMVKKFQEASKNITKFPPTTQEEFAKQLKELEDSATLYSGNIGTKFKESLMSINDNIREKLANTPEGAVGLFDFGLSQLTQTAVDRFGLGKTTGDDKTVIGATLLMLSGVQGSIVKDTGVGSAFSTLTSGLSTSMSSLATSISTPTTTAMTNIATAIRDNNPFVKGGVWDKAISGALDDMIAKYTGATNAINTAIDTSSGKFKTLQEIYDKYKNTTESSAGGGTTTTPAAPATPAAPTAPTAPATPPASATPVMDAAKKAFASAYPNYRGADATTIVDYVFDIFKDFKTNRSAGYSAALSKYIKNNSDWSKGAKYTAYQAASKYFVAANGNYGFQYGGLVPGFRSSPVPATLHGGEFVINSKAVNNIGLATLQQMNAMRFRTPTAPQGPEIGSTTHTQNINLYVDNFIGEQAWFESMMKDYNIKVSPNNQKAAGMQSRNISTYNGLNRGL